MTEPVDIVDRADSLMQRRRTFVAARPASTPTAHPPAAHEEDDLPVLTEVVSPEAAISEAKTERIDETQVTLLASEIAHAFAEQLASDLPALLETALLNASKELRTGISTIMESALRDFLARRKQLHLPLEETGND